MPSSPEPRVGEVWDVDFDPRVGREQGGIRPALVISNDQFNRVRNGLHIIVPLTGTDRGLAYHVAIRPPEGGLTKPSVIMCEQERSQSIRRFMRRRGRVSSETLQRVQEIVGLFIDR